MIGRSEADRPPPGAVRPAKVFGIGFHKTGTTSLGGALGDLGYTVTGPNGVYDLEIERNLHDLASRLIDEYDAFQDNPWPLLFRWLDRRVPNAKFILTLRDEQEWLESVVRHFGDEVTPMREMIYGAGMGSPKGNEAVYLDRYRAHNAEVLEYFSGRDDLLILRLTDGEGWEKLCPFLGHPHPGRPFPHQNRASSRSRSRQLFGRVAASLRGLSARGSGE